jgi:RecA-family ATPase
MSLSVINKNLDAIALRQDRKSKFLLYRELEAVSRKEWLIGGLLGAGDGSAWYGIPGCGKSVLVQDMGLHLAAGREWHGRAVKQGAVLYVALERKKLVERRAIAFRERHAIADIPFAVVGGVFDLRTPQAVATLIEAAREVEAETGETIVLIVIDTISRAMCGGDENSPKDMGAIVAATSRLQSETKAHVLWVHHMPQDGAERLRGHGALLGAMDTTVHVEKLADDLRTASVVKANDSEEGERVAFTLESITIGPETTAPVVVQADPALAKPSNSKRRLSSRAKLALDALTESVLSHGQPALLELQLPPGIRTVTLDQWRDELIARNVIDPKAANPRTDFRRCLDQLASKTFIASRGNLVWAV